MIRLILIIMFWLLCFQTSFAHEAIASGGFKSGLFHPVFGLDHLIAMVSVGILSSQIGGRAIWTVPASFVSIMLIGGILGIKEIPLFAIEKGIALSLLILGLSIAFHKKYNVFLTMFLVGFFGIFHGYAHGIEIPYLPRAELYVLGFIVSTTFLHILGVFIGLFCNNFPQKRNGIYSVLGTAIILCGIYFFIQTLP